MYSRWNLRKASSACVLIHLFRSRTAAAVATWPCHCSTNVGRKKKELLTLSRRERFDLKMFIRSKESNFKKIFSALFSSSLQQLINQSTYKIRNWRSVFRSSLRIIERLLNCNSLEEKKERQNWFFFPIISKQVDDDIIIVKFSWDVNFIVNLFITRLVDDVVIVSCVSF